MVDITKYPYFSYNQIVGQLFQPISNQANIQFLNFQRSYPNRERFCIIGHRDQMVGWCAEEFYKHCPFMLKSIQQTSAYHMWDHQPFAHTSYVQQIIRYNARKHNIAHGLTIIRKHPEYCDYFVFATTPNDDQVNNFYLNQVPLFEAFIQDFYQTLDPEFQVLSNHKIFIPPNTSLLIDPFAGLSSRQQDCIALLREGQTAKEIGKTLGISHRTVEGYLDQLKSKYEAKNLLHLMSILPKDL